MSGRSAYVRKKKTEPKGGDRTGSRGRQRSTGSSEQDDLSFGDFPMPHGQLGPVPVGTGVGTTNARFLKFSDPMREAPADPITNLRNMSTPSVGSNSNGSSSDGRREGHAMGNYPGQMDDYAYARFRRPTTKTEDVSGIEKSGLRSKLDKKSEDVRKGLAKTFTFKKKDKNGLRSPDKLNDYRPESAATVRQNHYMAEPDYRYDQYNHGVDPLHTQPEYPPQGQDQWDPNVTSPPPSGRLPPIPSQISTLPPIKRWVGFGRPTQRWNKLRKDPELWDPNGDVLVFFGHKGQMPRPNPSFRLSSHIIESTESRYLLTLLREGSTEEDFSMPPDPAGAPPMLGGHSARGHHMLGYGMGRSGQPTPPISEDASLGEADGQISYEMYFPTPTNMSKVDQLRHQITTRNVFAMLYHASLVGLSLYQALTDLHTRLDSYLLPENDNVGMIIHYLQARGIDDVRNDPETAVSLLAWSEGVEIRWDEGWQEAFVHCAGMYTQLERTTDFKHTTQISRALLDRANLETNVRVQKAEDRLVEFQYNDLWPVAGPASDGPARAAAERVQKFFLAHYSRVFGCWPPSPPTTHTPNNSMPASPVDSEGENEEVWLTRTIAQMLQKDFGALYDYLVNRDIIWDGSETRSGRKWMMVSESGNRGFDADLPDLPMTDMFVEFDNKQRFPHIPHPYPLVPESIPPMPGVVAKEGSGGGSGMFKSSNKKGSNGNGQSQASAARIRNFEQQIRLAYSVATNTDVLGSDLAQSDLVDAFVKFERQDLVGEVDPSVARRGRWVLIYGILQTLASVSVDWPAVRHKEDVPYHLSPRLKATKIPPWRHNGPMPEEASHELSHCWVTARLWNLAPHMSSSGAESSGGSGNTSPVVGNYPRKHSGWPRAPPSTSHSSAAGYHTPGTRSVRSSSSVQPYSAAPSVISESDAASSIRSPPSTRPPTSSSAGRMRSRGGDSKFGGGPASLRSAATFGGLGAMDRSPVDDRDMPVRRRDFAAHSDSGYGYGRSNTLQSSASSASGHGSGQVQHLPLSNSISGSGGFLAMDDMVETQSQSRSGTSMSTRQQRTRPILGRVDSDMGPIIRDFDELDVIDDAEP